MKDIVFASIDVDHSMEVFGFKFTGNSDNSLNAFFVGEDVCLDGFVFLGGSLKGMITLIIRGWSGRKVTSTLARSVPKLS